MHVVKVCSNPPVLNWWCWLMQVVLYNGHNMVVAVAVVVVVVMRRLMKGRIVGRYYSDV